jgi:predicted glutamine amidotransferase
MCELFAISSNRPTAVSYSLDEFATNGSRIRSNRSGWGIAYFDERDVFLVKEAAPAKDSPWVRFIEEQNLKSACVIAHVRYATVGADALHNTHPFRRVLGRHTHVFAHNGTLTGIHAEFSSDPLRSQPLGDTVSELAFCILLERLLGVWESAGAVPSIEDRFDVFCTFATEMREFGAANFLYSDGDALFIHGHRRVFEEDGKLTESKPPGLSIKDCARCQLAPRWSCKGLDIEAADKSLIMVASVPLDDDGWEPLPEGTAIVFQQGRERGRASTIGGTR